MNKKIIALLFAVVSSLYAAVWTGASSEPENMKKIDGKPFYVITNADELAWFVAKVNAGETAINAIFANDIVLGADTASFTNVAWKGMDKFDGILDGNGFAVYGLRFVNCYQFNPAENEIYFISELSKNGIVKNLILKKMEAIAPPAHSVSCGRQWGFVKWNNGLIYNVHNFTNRTFALTTEIGGIAFINNGEIRRSTNHSSIVSDNDSGKAGGIAGLNNGIIDSCQNYNGTSNVHKNSGGYMGGIVATNKGQIRYSINHAKSAESKIASRTTLGGGIAGSNSGEIMYCIQEEWTGYSLAINNTGKIISSIDISTLSYYSNNKKNSINRKVYEK